jgi:hypothetical protein
MTIRNRDPLRIDYAITEDDFDGAPVVPGFADDGIFWGCVGPLPGGKTRWRRVYLQQTSNWLAASTVRRPIELRMPRPGTPQLGRAISGGRTT